MRRGDSSAGSIPIHRDHERDMSPMDALPPRSGRVVEIESIAVA